MTSRKGSGKRKKKLPLINNYPKINAAVAADPLLGVELIDLIMDAFDETIRPRVMEKAALRDIDKFAKKMKADLRVIKSRKK